MSGRFETRLAQARPQSASITNCARAQMSSMAKLRPMFSESMARVRSPQPPRRV